MSEDWLALDSSYQNPVELSYTQKRLEALGVLRSVEHLLVSDTPLARYADALPIEPGKRAEAVQASWTALRYEQKVYLGVLKAHGFNHKATHRALAAAQYPLDPVKTRTWEDKRGYGLVLKAMLAAERERLSDPAYLMTRADYIAEAALEPKPILHHGEHTGFYEQNLDTGLRANEQLMKASGLLRQDVQSSRVTVRFVNLAGMEGMETVIDSTAEEVQEDDDPLALE